MNKQISGQINLFDIFKEEPKESPVLLNPGQIVYLVVRGDIEPYKVSDRSWDIQGTNRGYDLFNIESNTHSNVTWNVNINKDTFTDKDSAELKANEYIFNNDCILAKDMYIKELVAYKHGYLGKEIYNWYAVLENNMIYYHYGGKYDHIGSTDEIKTFEEDNSKVDSTVVYDYIPHFKNMYKCDTDSNWLYADAHYQFFHL
jgi:hypothetical protein